MAASKTTRATLTGLVLLSCCPLPSAIADETRSYYLDWVPRQELPLELQQSIPPYCKGAYVEPQYLAPELRSIDPSTQEVSAEYDRLGGSQDRYSLEGNVVIQQGARRVESDKLEIDRESDLVISPGETRYREPGTLVLGQSSQVDLENDTATLQGVEFVAHESEMRGTATELTRTDDGVIHISRGEVTRCEPGMNTWALSAASIRIDEESGRGVARNAMLKVKDVPVLYTPYIQFPLDDRRMSGFLFPQLGSSDDGVDFAVPYYLNLAPNYDATLTPRLIGDRGAMLESEFRYLRPNGRGEIGGAYLPGDDEYNGEDRWLGRYYHQGRVFDRIQTLVDYSGVSDEDYFSDLGTDLSVSSQTYLLRRAQASYEAPLWRTSLRVQDYQTLDILAPISEPFARLPELGVNFFYPHETTNLDFKLDAQYVYFDRDNDQLSGLARAVGQRTSITPSVTWNLERPYGYFRPQAQYTQLRYSLKNLDANLNDTPEVGVPLYSIDAGLYFERPLSLFNSLLTQTLEPRVFYLKVPYRDQQELPDFDTSLLTFSYNQVFRHNRFVGGDRIGDADQISMGLTTRFIDESGFERFRASAVQIFYAQEPRVSLNNEPLGLPSKSAYAAEFQFALQSGWRVFGDLEWDPNEDRTNESSINLRYRGDNRHIFNIGYRQRKDRQRIEQSDISIIWPLSARWSLIARWNRDLLNQRDVELLAGVKYESCCWNVSVAGRRWINDDDLFAADGVEEKQGVYIQVQLKGLAGIGDSLEGIIKNSITGYRERSSYESY